MSSVFENPAVQFKNSIQMRRIVVYVLLYHLGTNHILLEIFSAIFYAVLDMAESCAQGY